MFAHVERATSTKPVGRVKTALHKSSMADSVEEREATYFAMCLLMPAEDLRRDIQAMGGIDIEDEKGLKKLARRYRVSPMLMTLRIGQLMK